MKMTCLSVIKQMINIIKDDTRQNDQSVSKKNMLKIGDENDADDEYSTRKQCRVA